MEDPYAPQSNTQVLTTLISRLALLHPPRSLEHTAHLLRQLTTLTRPSRFSPAALFFLALVLSIFVEGQGYGPLSPESLGITCIEQDDGMWRMWLTADGEWKRSGEAKPDKDQAVDFWVRGLVKMGREIVGVMVLRDGDLLGYGI
jgi:hypothetical protein